MDSELLEILVAFALTALSHYNLDSVPLPLLEEKPHPFFVENVCGGIEKKCRGVVGWYNNDGIIYINKNIPDTFKDEVVIHEVVHYVQDLSGIYDNDSCEDSDYREKEAFRIQSKYMIEAKGKLLYTYGKNSQILCKK
ncbi:MAG: hypothetical protein IIA85_01880 [Nanoarchaeota archaeon]|nr:hypothetical protein [Nanoarchaeota archaeon]